MMAATEVGRKLLGYSLVRPAREVLFTVVTRDEKYKAKLVGGWGHTSFCHLLQMQVGSCTSSHTQHIALFSPAVQVLNIRQARSCIGTSDSNPVMLWL
jgi:hypothetical protein